MFDNKWKQISKTEPTNISVSDGFGLWGIICLTGEHLSVHVNSVNSSRLTQLL